MITIGRKDRLDLPDLDLFDIEAKIDSGAYGCTLHSHHFEIINIDGKEELHYKLLDPNHPEYEDRVFVAKEFGQKIVRSSNGVNEERFTIKTSLRIFDKKYIVKFSLTDRRNMKYPILLGCKFLKNRFMVDVSKKDLSFNEYKR